MARGLFDTLDVPGYMYMYVGELHSCGPGTSQTETAPSLAGTVGYRPMTTGISRPALTSASPMASASLVLPMLPLVVSHCTTSWPVITPSKL